MTRPRGLQPQAWFVTRIGRPLLRLSAKWRIFHVSVYGRRHIPTRGAAIIACNHQSFADPVVVWGSVSRNLVAVAMKELWRTPLVLLMWLLGHIPIDRGNRTSGAKTRQRMTRVVRAGGLLLIFPEGKCSRDGKRLPLKPGATDIAWETGVPVIPAGIAGTNAVWPLGRRRLNRDEHVVLVYGEPLSPNAFHSANEMKDALAERIDQLMAEAQRRRN
ncbi:MAG TPA: lysophospholipid acyltransferase family protein [Candidatus Saccharimonas sp.]|nr:lysophospholipid acyltransferase family protein [Candidatus Saccharimonas sp.]